MALLDSYFSPQSYRGMGGLLDLLPMMQMQPGASAGFPVDPASLPNNAQPMAGPPLNISPQAAPASQSIGVGDRLMAGFQGFANAGGGLLPAISNAVSGFATGKRADPRGMAVETQNQTVQALVQRGLDPEMAKTVASDPGLLRAVLPQVMGIGGQTDDIKEYQFAKQQGFQGTLVDWIQRKRAGAGEYSLTPQYGTNDKGETVLIQTGKSGEAIQTKLPPNIKISSGVEKIDLGTQWGILNKRDGTIIGYQPKDIVGKEAAEEVGKAKGQAQANLPTAIATGEQTLAAIDNVLNDPYRKLGTGVTSVGNIIPGTPMYDFGQKVEQLKGKAFLEAFNTLKGGGQITEVEGKKATDAIARLSTAQTTKGFEDALTELRGIVTAGIERAKQKAGVATSGASGAPAVPSAPPSRPSAPEVGTTKGGYRFRGGDPSKRENWEPVT